MNMKSPCAPHTLSLFFYLFLSCSAYIDESGVRRYAGKLNVVAAKCHSIIYGETWLNVR